MSINEVELQTLDYLTSQEFLDTFGGDYCDMLNSRLDKLSPELRDIGRTLTDYEKRNIFSGNDYQLLKSKYFLLEIRAYTLFTKLKRECNLNNDLVLFFYDQKHDESQRQGYVLDDVVKFDGIHVFSFDRNFEIIRFLVDRYKIKTAPTIIINENKTSEGFIGVGEIRTYLESES